MDKIDIEEGRYRILLIGIGGNSKEEKDSFCHNLSKKYNIPILLLKKIVERCPIILKKNLSLKKAEILAKTLKSFGATVTVEERRDFPTISLEFQELVPHQLGLESSCLRKSPRGTWSIIGRIKNISEEMLSDTWALIQLFNVFDELITFEEAPLTINPLPFGEISPFKIVFEGDFTMRRISIAFKNASGQPIAAVDKRKKREWMDVEINDEDGHFLSSQVLSQKIQQKAIVIELAGPSKEMVRQARENSSFFPWIEVFKDAVEAFYQRPRDIFTMWFAECQKKGELVNSLHALLTILVHSRFDQANQSINALENTQRVYRILVQQNLILEEIPLLEGTNFVFGEVWRDLFHRALPKVQLIGNAILEKSKWKAFDLERLIQVIPHMGHQNSRLAIRSIHELIPYIVEVDFSDTPISIEESLYRVACRLGIVDPHFDFFRGRNSMGDIKIQSFAKTVFPQNPAKIEEPMTWMGKGEEQEGHCFPTQPRCEGCLFEFFCPKLYFHFNPSEKGLRK